MNNKTFALVAVFVAAVQATLFAQIDGQEASFVFNQRLSFVCESENQFFYRENETPDAEYLPIKEEAGKVKIEKREDGKVEVIINKPDMKYADYIYYCKSEDKIVEQELDKSGFASMVYGKELSYTCATKDQFYYRVNESFAEFIKERKDKIEIKETDDGKKWRVIVENPDQYDAGYTYYCKSEKEEVKQELQIAPDLFEEKNERIGSRSSVDLKCRLKATNSDSSSPVVFKWLRNDKAIIPDEDKNLVIKSSWNESTLTISKEIGLAGTYKCVATNAYGTAELRIKLLDIDYDLWMFLGALGQVILITVVIFIAEKTCLRKQ